MNPEGNPKLQDDYGEQVSKRCDYRRQWLRRYNTTGFKDGARGPPAEESGRLQDLAQARIQKSFPRASRQEPALLTA